MTDHPFDYESAVWGGEDLRCGDRTIAGYRLHEAVCALPYHGVIAEVGCGAGRFLRAIGSVRPDVRLVGLDISRAALRRAAALGTPAEMRLISGADASLPAADGEFDAVLMLDVLEHVNDPSGLLAEVHRVTKPKGVVHLHVPCEEDWLALWRWLPGQRGERALKRRFGGHVQRFRRQDIAALLRAAGFAPERLRYSLHIFGNLADLVAFVVLALIGPRSAGDAVTTSDFLQRDPGTGSGAGVRSLLFRSVDWLLWLEARVLSRLPSWSVHVSARRATALHDGTR